MSEQPSGELRALKREWLLARLILALGIIGPIGLYLWLSLSPAVLPEPTMTAGASVAETQSEPVHRDDEAVVQGMRLCAAAIASARNFGIVPASTHPNGPAGTSDTVGRYLCRTSSGADAFTIAVDLECRNLGDERCLSLFSVVGVNGRVLYQRQS